MTYGPAVEWLRRGAMALWAWICRRVAQFTDWLIDQAARTGESLDWWEVERIAKAKIREEERRVEEIQMALQGVGYERHQSRAIIAEAMADAGTQGILVRLLKRSLRGA